MNEMRPAWLPPPDPAGPVTCAACGCRLVEVDWHDGPAWRHFPSLHAGRDARGDRPPCVEALHDRRGRSLEVARTPEHAAGDAQRELLDETFLPDPQRAAAA